VSVNNPIQLDSCNTENVVDVLVDSFEDMEDILCNYPPNQLFQVVGDVLDPIKVARFDGKFKRKKKK